jgi:uncharacterized membrane protein
MDTCLEKHDRRSLAAICHLFGIIPLYGPVFSWIIWMVSPHRTGALRFHALQALAAQCFYFLVILLPVSGLLLSKLFSAASVPVGRAIGGFSMFLLQAVFVAFWLLFAFAAAKVLRTGDFRYPVAGDLVERLMDQENTEKK